MNENTPNKLEFLKSSLQSCKTAFYYLLVLSCISNIMMLAVPIYSAQVLDRVISSSSMETLLMLTIVVVISLLCLSILQVFKSFIFTQLGNWLDRRFAKTLFADGIAKSAYKKMASNNQHFNDFNGIKNFLTGHTVSNILDIPWSFIFLAAIFFIHPTIGVMSVIGGIVFFGIAILNELLTKPIIDKASEGAVISAYHSEIAARNAEVIEAMGMLGNVSGLWQKAVNSSRIFNEQAGNRAAVISGVTKFLRLLIQILVTGVGAYYVIKNEMTSGSMIASGILVGRALAPFENAISSWKSFVVARKSYTRLKGFFESGVDRLNSIELPAPTGKISLDNVYFAPTGSQKPVIKGVSFSLEPGEVLAIIGPSASGKSTIAKLLTGVWKVNSGNVRLDDADVYTWPRESFGQYIGYLPQDIELFPGSVKLNIARMNENAKDEDIITAAQESGAHEFILHLPKGYETEVGPNGAYLSAGQCQRVALARAFYGRPRMIVLDEPNSNLDGQGEHALAKAIENAKQDKSTVIIISHRQAVLQVVDKIMVIENGQVVKFGARDEVLGEIHKKMPQQNLKLVKTS